MRMMQTMVFKMFTLWFVIDLSQKIDEPLKQNCVDIAEFVGVTLFILVIQTAHVIIPRISRPKNKFSASSALKFPKCHENRPAV
jgi:hypothetical protein